MAMTRAQFARDIQAGLYAHFGMNYDNYKPEWPEIFEKKRSNKAYEEMVLRVGLGEAKFKEEGGVISFDQGAEGWVARASFHTYALAFAITEEAVDDNLYADLVEVYGKELAKALQNAKEVRGADMLNNAFDANYSGGDGKSLCSSDHPLYAGGASSNKLSTAADISEEALEDSVIQLSGFVNDRHRPIVVKPKKLIIPRQQMFTTQRLLKSTGRVGTDLNDINAIKDGNYIPGGYTVNHFLVDPDAWFLQTDSSMGLMYWQRKGVQKNMEDDFRTGNIMVKIQERFGFSFADWRAILGSEGSPV